MYASPFEYLRATSWDEAVRLLQEYGEDARVLAGGQSLGPMMNLRLAQPPVIVDLNTIPRQGITMLDGALHVGALTRHHELEGSSVIADSCPLLAEAASMVGNVRVRHRGTIGGSAAHADPSAELPCALIALDARFAVLGPSGVRRVAAKDFFVSFFTTSLEDAEVITTIEVPAAPGGSGSAFLEAVRRTGDFATVEVAVQVELDEDERCSNARVVLGGIGHRPVDVSEAAAPLLGSRLDPAEAERAAREVANVIEPRADERGSAEYRRHLSEVLTRRAVVRAARRARGGGEAG